MKHTIYRYMNQYYYYSNHYIIIIDYSNHNITTIKFNHYRNIIYYRYITGLLIDMS